MATKIVDNLKNVAQAAVDGALKEGSKAVVTATVTDPTTQATATVTAKPAPTPGVKTTEFWVGAIAAGLGGVMQYVGIPTEVTAMVVGPLVAYILSRGVAKAGK